jgi:putative tryptophan/tyrosine transport system substrate-binding protein
VQSGARVLGLETLIFEASDPTRFDSIFADATSQGVNGLVGMASAFLNFHHHRLIELAARYRLPSIWESSGYVRDGGLPGHVSAICRLHCQDLKRDEGE